MIKKLLVMGLGSILLLAIAAIVGMGMLVNKAVKAGVEKGVPAVAKVPASLDSVGINFRGAGVLNGLVIGNPEGFKSEHAIRIGKASLSLQPKSIFSDKIIINSIHIEEPSIILEGSRNGTNLKQILKNIESVTGGSGGGTEEEKEAASQKFQVDDFKITNARVKVALAEIGGMGATVTIPEIHLTGLGAGEEGITGAELGQRILQELLNGTTQAAGSMDSLGGKAAELLQGAAGKGGETLNKAAEGLKGLFQKK